MQERAAPKRTDSDSAQGATPFVASVRQALEHVCDTTWLRDNSYLQSVTVHAKFPVDDVAAIAMTRVTTTGLPEIDARLRRIWRDWTDRDKTPLQRIFWEAICRMHQHAGRDISHQTLLLLTYYDDPRPKQVEIIKLLAFGRTTYFRRLEQAVDLLRAALIETLRPALSAESPAAPALIGRDDLLRACRDAFNRGAVACVIGASGLGKTALGANAAAAYKHGVFWHTFRRGIGDHVEQMLYALAYFLHVHGASNAWLYLMADAQRINNARALALIRQALHELRAKAPLLCFDEVDLLIDDELSGNPEHTALLSLLEELARGERYGAPMLLIGQRLVIEPDADALLQVERFEERELNEWLRTAGLTVDQDSSRKLLEYTRGNPLLLKLFFSLQRAGDEAKRNVSALLATLSGPASLDWFLMRLWPHLSAREQDALRTLSVFDGPVPASAFNRNRRALTALLHLELVDASDLANIEVGALLLHPALRDAIQRTLSAEQAQAAHGFAAQVLAERGEITAAARHFVEVGRPDMAIWIWAAHADQEIAQGQREAALSMFERVRQLDLPGPDDTRALALILAKLYRLTGSTQDGLDVLDQAVWPVESAAAAQAEVLRGQLLAMQGQIDRALDAYRSGLTQGAGLRAAQGISARAELARQTRVRAQDPATAQREASRAQHDVEMLLGELADERGELAAAQVHFERARAVARDIDDPVLNAKAHEALGILLAHQSDVDGAQAHLLEAGKHYAAYGNTVCAIGVTQTNLSYAYLVARRYAEAIPPAQQAIAFFEPLAQPYWIALNQTNLAEAHAHLGDLDTAEQFAQRALAHEEGAVRPYCFYVLSHVARQRGAFITATGFARDAIALSEAAEDPWALGPALQAQAFAHRDAGETDAYRDALQQMLRLYTRLGVQREIDALKRLLVEFEETE